MANFKILVLHDGKPGYLSQSLGLAELIGEFHSLNCDIQTLRVKPVLKLLNRPLRKLASTNAKYAWRAAVAGHYREQLPARKPDLIISFGGNSLAMNIALSRYWRVANLHIGNCYGVSPTLIRVNPVLAADGVRNNQLSTLIPINRRLAESGSPPLSADFDGGSKPRWLMLVGGAGSGYDYRGQDWHDLAAGLADCAERHNICWVISTSRRSGQEAEGILRSALQDKPWCETAIWASQPGAQTLASLMTEAERIFCTEDSLSMVSEAVALAKPVVSLAGKRIAWRNSHQCALATFAEQGLVHRLEWQQLSSYEPLKFEPTLDYRSLRRDIFLGLQGRGVLQPLRRASRRRISLQLAPV